MENLNFSDKIHHLDPRQSIYGYSNNYEENKENFSMFKKKPMAIKHSNLPEDFKISYVEYDDFENFENNVDSNEIFESIKIDFESKNWIQEFRGLNNIRRIHKFYPSEINILFEAFGDYIRECLISPRTCILRNSIALVNEIVENSSKSGIQISILIKLPTFLIPLEKHTSLDIKTMSKVTLSNFTQKCCCPEMLNVFLELSAKKNQIINEKSFFYLTELIGVMGESISNLNTETLKKMFFVLAINLTESKFPKNRNCSKRIFCYIQNLMGSINFMKFLELMMKENILDFSTCKEISECENKKKKSTRISIKEDLTNMNYIKKSRSDLNIEIYTSN